MGCIARLGCLFILACAAVVGWFTRDRWMPESWRHATSGERRAASGPTWQPMTAAGAERTRAALSKLSEPRGPAFQTLTGADVASYAFRELTKRLPASTDSIETMVQGGSLSMRANIKLSDLGGSSTLGALGGMLGDRERVQFTGTLRVVHPGLGEFQIQDVKVKGLSLPHGMISTLIGRFDRTTRPAGVDADALPLPLPSYIGDIRIANGKITLYKNVQ
jgi:hypothetical protein